MEKKKNPSLGALIPDIFNIILTIALPLITWWLYSKWYYSIILLLCIICIILIYKMYSYSKEVKILYEDYSKTFDNHSELAKQFEKKIKIINNKDAIINEYKFIMLRLLNDIHSSILPINKYEKKYLENLYKATYSDIEHLQKMEGEIKNGKNI